MKKNKFNWKRVFNSIFKWLSDVLKYVEKHWPRLMLSLLTATFTWQAAYILTGEVYYAVMAVVLAEGLFLYWLSRIESYENTAQGIIATVMFLVSCTAIFLTDIASAVLIANKNDTLQFYNVVPDWVGWVVTNVTPILASFNLITYGLFEYMSDTNRDKREHDSRTRNVERIVKASKRDIMRLKARVRVLRTHRTLSQIEKRHNKMFGETLVEKVNGMMQMELMEKKSDNKQDIVSFISGLLKKKDGNIIQRKKRKYIKKGKHKR